MKKHPVPQRLAAATMTFAFALALAPAGLFVACGEGDEVVAVASVTLNQTAMTLGMDGQGTL
jgi:hypothetical protein